MSAAANINLGALWHKGLVRWRQARRAFDARALAERRLIVIAVVALIWFAMDSLFLTPKFKGFKAASARLGQAETALFALQERDRQRVIDAARLHTAVKADLAATRQLIHREREEFERARQVLVPARDMRALLEGLLAEQKLLRLRSMRTLPREDIHLPAVSGAGAAGLLYKHGLEIKVEGGFHDLLNWMRSVESLPSKLMWDGLKLEADEQSVLTLTVKVHTLSPDPEPLEIAP